MGIIGLVQTEYHKTYYYNNIRVAYENFLTIYTYALYADDMNITIFLHPVTSRTPTAVTYSAYIQTPIEHTPHYT